MQYIVFFEVERIYGAYEEKKCEISRFNGAFRRVGRRAEGSARLCKDDGHFSNGSK